MKRLKIFAVVASLFVIASCETLETKQEAFPSFYDDNQNPVSMVIVPALNETAAADAGELVSATLVQPFADNGYYVVPLPIVSQIFQSEGNSLISQLLQEPMQCQLCCLDLSVNLSK